MNIVLDTNVFLVSLPSHSKYYAIYDALLNKVFDLYVTTEILLEYEEIFAQKLGTTRADLKLKELLNRSNIYCIEPFYNWPSLCVGQISFRTIGRCDTNSDQH